MKQWRFISRATAALLAAGALQLQCPASSELFPAHQTTFDLFGSVNTRNKSGQDDTSFALGLGANYFFAERWGAGVDMYSDAFRLPYVLNASGIFRYPFPDYAVAPYALAGFGRQWKYAAQWQAHIGAGVDYAFCPHYGVFGEIRQVFPDRTKDYLMFRVGVRFTFW